MALLTKSAFLSKYNGLFATNGTQAITAATLRDFVADTKDSFPSFLDDAAMMGLANYSPSRTYSPGQATLNAGKLYLCTLTTTGTFDTNNWVSLPIPDAYFQVEQWDEEITYTENELVAWNYRLWSSTADDNAGEEPGSGDAWEVAEAFTDPNMAQFISGKVYADNIRVINAGTVYQKNEAGLSSNPAAEAVYGKWTAVGMVVFPVRFQVDHEQLVGMSGTEAEFPMLAALPAGACPVVSKVVCSEGFTGGANVSASCEVYHGAYDPETVLTYGSVFAINAFGTSGAITMPSHTSDTNITVRVTVDSNITTITAGHLEVFISYILFAE